MNNPFYKNALLTRLCNLLDDLPNQEDKNSIAAIIKKQMPVSTEYNFSLEQLKNVTNREIGSHGHRVEKSRYFATEYLYSLYKIDFGFDHDDNNDDDIFWKYMDDKWYKIIKDFSNDFVLIRACIYKYYNSELREEGVKSFDLYVTNLFIEKYLEIKNEYDTIQSQFTTEQQFQSILKEVV